MTVERLTLKSRPPISPTKTEGFGIARENDWIKFEVQDMIQPA